MNIGLYINAGQNTSYQDAIEQVALADRLGFSSVWLTEKHFDQGHLLWSSPFIAASCMAAKTQRIKIGFAACSLLSIIPSDWLKILLI
jgi:alkanesulfonate monooxygenase SsuD/methylene tetrahydromethanopterin reductase-like flavin-dependent oxidoreductase (luciferase family)